MLKTKSLLLYLSTIKWSNPTPSVISQLKLQSKRNHNVIKDNGMEIVDYLTDLIEDRAWKNMGLFLREVNVGLIDQWALWGKLVKVMDHVSEDVGKAGDRDLEAMLEVMSKLRYEPYEKGNPKLFTLVKSIIEEANLNRIAKIGASSLVYWPQIFEKHKEELERLLLGQLKKAGTLSDTNYSLFSQGVISNFWTPDFLTSISELPNFKSPMPPSTHKFQKYLQLPISTAPAQIATQPNPNPSQTEYKVGLLLSDLGYRFSKNVLINGTEVDFYFQGVRLIVQYDGMWHYRLNQLDGRIYYSKYMRWRKGCFKAKGFTVLGLPFFEWNRLEGEKAQKLYLINKIERAVMKRYQKLPHQHQQQQQQQQTPITP